MSENLAEKIKQLQDVQKVLSLDLDLPAIEALIMTFEMILGQDDEEFTALPAATLTKLKDQIATIDFQQLSSDDQRQVVQLLLVATMREDQLQANYQITPDAIGLWLTYFVDYLGQNKKLNVLDLTAGSGNLLATVAATTQSDATFTAVENDDTLATVASGVAAVLGQEWQVINDDAIQLPNDNQFDIVIGDVPVGFYPKEVPANFTLQAEDQTYVHHLLIEKSVQLLKENGTALLVVPSELFNSEQAPLLLQLLQSEQVYFQALLQFSGRLFSGDQTKKGLLILQKAGSEVEQAKPALLGAIPAADDLAGNQAFLAELNTWLSDNHLISK